MIEKSYSITTQACTSRQMWEVLIDLPNWPRFHPDLAYVKPEGPIAQGTYFVLKPKKGPKVRIQIVVLEKHRQFTDCTRFPGARMYGDHVLAQQGNELTATTTMRMAGPLGWLWWKLVGRQVAASLGDEMHRQIELASKIAV